MNITVVIPVGPGHEAFALDAERSVVAAWANDRGPFSRLTIALIDDSRGLRGRSAARNFGMDENPADWHFLLDADDQMMPGVFTFIDLDSPATFGALMLNGWVPRDNRFPVTHQTILDHGALGTIAMGFFVRGDLGLRFDESLDHGEDFDFYMRLPSFTKVRDPLVNIGYNKPCAGGPRGGRKPWIEVCAAVIDRYRHARPIP